MPRALQIARLSLCPDSVSDTLVISDTAIYSIVSSSSLIEHSRRAIDSSDGAAATLQRLCTAPHWPYTLDPSLHPPRPFWHMHAPGMRVDTLEASHATSVPPLSCHALTGDSLACRLSSRFPQCRLLSADSAARCHPASLEEQWTGWKRSQELLPATCCQQCWLVVGDSNATFCSSASVSQSGAVSRSVKSTGASRLRARLPRSVRGLSHRGALFPRWGRLGVE